MTQTVEFRNKRFETKFENWFRNNQRLTDAGIVKFDLDMLVHRYFRIGSRDRTYQCMMFVEVKTGTDKINSPQIDTLHILNQVLRNRGLVEYGDFVPDFVRNNTPLTEAFSVRSGRYIKLRMFGGHYLMMSGSTPLDSAEMFWSGSRPDIDIKFPITIDALERILLFEIDPDDPRRTLTDRERYGFYEKTQEALSWEKGES